MIEHSLITPPPELFAEWLAEAKRLHPRESTGFIAGEVAKLAYRAGADQELEACCEWLQGFAPCEAQALRSGLHRGKRAFEAPPLFFSLH